MNTFTLETSKRFFEILQWILLPQGKEIYFGQMVENLHYENKFQHKTWYS